jgi:tRNA G10  N-methylase Trm11
MSTHLFVLGHTPQLSLAELRSLLPKQELETWSNHLVATSLLKDQQADQLQEILGGVFKILKIVMPLPSAKDEMLSEITQHLKNFKGKILFGLTFFPKSNQLLSAADIKNSLKVIGKKSRYQQTDDWGLSTAILSHEPDALDLFVIENSGQHYLAQTCAYQNLEAWVKRDRKKPYSSGKRGMLPPKLARVLVNLGLGQLDMSPEHQSVLYDPFCGTGTVLIEGLLRGCEVIGSDSDSEAVAGTIKNLYWLEDQLEQKVKYQVFQGDVAHVTKHLWEVKPNLIVTEPFMGKPNPKPSELKNIFTGLRSLYLGAFKAWAQILDSQAVVVIVFPQVRAQNKEYNLLELIDKIAGYGYTLQVEPIDYGYQKSVVKRQILVFKYQK